MTKNKPEILIINQYYPPDTSATASVVQTIAQAFSETFNVKIIAGRPSYNPETFHPWYFFKKFRNKNVKVLRVGSTSHSRLRMTKRLLNYFSYFLLSIPHISISSPSAILCMTDPPIACLLGAFFSKRKKSPFIYYVQDLHPDMALASGIVKKGVLFSIWENIHQWAMLRADLIIVLDRDMRKKVIQKGIHPTKVAIVRHGAPIPSHMLLPSKSIRGQFSDDFAFTVVHAGNIGFYGAWRTIIDAAKKLQHQKIGFVFIGEGAHKHHVMQMASECNNVKFIPFQPVEYLPDILAYGDIHLVSIQSGIEGTVFPSKLYPILAAGRPVLAVANETSDLAQIVKNSGCGVVASPGNSQSIVSVLERLANNKDRLRLMKKQSLLLSNQFDRRKQMDRLIYLVETQIIAARRESGKIKVLRVIARLNIGGPAIHVNLLHKSLRSDRFDSSIVIGSISPGEGDMGYLFKNHAEPPIIIQELQREVNLLKDIQTLIKFMQILKRYNPTLFIHTPQRQAAIARLSGFLLICYSVKILRRFTPSTDTYLKDISENSKASFLF